MREREEGWRAGGQADAQEKRALRRMRPSVWILVKKFHPTQHPFVLHSNDCVYGGTRRSIPSPLRIPKGARARYFHVGFPQIWALRCFSVICLRVERNIALAFDRIAGKGASAAPNSHGALHTRAPHVSPHPLVLLWRIPPQQQRTTPEALVRRGQVRFR